MQLELPGLRRRIADLSPAQSVGRVDSIEGAAVWLTGLAAVAGLGDRLRLFLRDGTQLEGEVLRITEDLVAMLPDAPVDGIARGDRVALLGPASLAPSDNWIGRVIDPLGRPLDGRPLFPGPAQRGYRAAPPAASQRRGLGARLDTGLNVFNSVLPLARGQRIGLFAGSGVGKSTLTAHLARNVNADVVVLALVGERGRELRDFVEEKLGPEGMKRTVVVAATSDRSPIERRRCALAAMTVAEHFRDRGDQVFFVIDSITRFAEAHREAAIAAGELPALRGFPASTAHQIMSLCERAGPGIGDAGDITGLFSVLVAGSDMEEPIADILRGVLDGHVVLDRQIAERGRYPAVDVLRSVSRCLPEAATTAQNVTIAKVRELMGAYAANETMIRAGLYRAGTDPLVDLAVKLRPDLEAFLAQSSGNGIEDSFARIELLLRRGGASGRPAGPRET